MNQQISKPVTSKERFNRDIVNGKTTISHHLRLSLSLSLEEYTVLDFVFAHNQESRKEITFGDLYTSTGFMPNDARAFIKNLKDKGLLVWNKKENRIDVYDEWKIAHGTSDYFEDLWKILKKGNKATAKDRFPKVMKKIEFPELKQKLINYVNHCDRYNIFKKGLDVWLNPAKEYWNDPLVTQSNQKEPQKKSTVKLQFK